MTLGVLKSTLPDSQITAFHTNPTQQSFQNGVVCVGLVAKKTPVSSAQTNADFSAQKNADFSAQETPTFLFFLNRD